MRFKGTTKNSYRGAWSVAGWLGLLILMSACLWAQSETDKGVLRSKPYKFRHTDSQTIKTLLTQLKIGTEYTVLSKDTLLVTTNRSFDLAKATSVIGLADKEKPVEIRPLMVPSETVPAPTTAELAVRLKTMTLGTLLDAPLSTSPNAAIVDMVEGTLVGIGTAESLDMIETAIKAWKDEKSPKPVAEPSAPEAVQQESEPAADPNASEKPAEQTEPEVVLEPAQPSLTETEAQIPQEVQAEQPVVDKEQLATDEFMAQELIETLDAEAQKIQASQPEPQAAAPAVPLTEETTETPAAAESEETPQEDLPDALKKLLEAVKQQEQSSEAAVSETPAAVTEIKEEPKANEEAEKPAAKPVRAVTSPELSQEKAEEELELTITLPEEIEIEALLELVGKQLGLNYMYDKAIFQTAAPGQPVQGPPGKVMLKIHDGKIKVREMYSLLESVLQFKGYVMTRRNNLVTITRADNVASIDPVLRRPDEPIRPGDVVVSSIFELKNVSTSTVQEMLSQMRLGSTFNTIPETNTLVITDYAFRMERIREVIAMVDVEGTPKDFRYRQLRYMQAAELTPKVQALASQMQGVTVTIGDQKTVAPTTVTPARIPPARAPRPGQPGQPVPPVQPQPAAGQAPDRQLVYLEADERTNRVLMIGYPSEIEIVNKLIDSLDVAGYNLRYLKEYVIQNVEAMEVITVLNELEMANVSLIPGYRDTMTPSQQRYSQRGQMMPPVQQPGQPQMQMQPGQMTSTSTAASTASEPLISLRSATNSLLVNATEEQHQAIELVIAHVDVLQHDQRTIREYEIQYVDTQSILDTLTALKIISPRQDTANSMYGGRSTGMGTSSNRNWQQQQQQMMMQQQMMQPGGMQGEGGGLVALPTADGTEREVSAAEPQIAVLASTNSLLVHATPRQHASIAMVIAHADRQLDQTFAPYVIYALENQDPDELAEVLNKLIKETVEEKLAAAGTTTASAPDARIQTRPTGMATLPSGEEQLIRIIPDPKTYSLVVYANKRNQQWVGELIRQLDEYRPQVLLDCTLVEVTKDDLFKYEIDLVSKTYSDLTLRPGTTGSLDGAGTSIANLGGSTSFDPRTYAQGSSDAGIFTGFFNTDMIQGILTAMQQNKYGRIMARPKILVNDNQEGEIKSENTISVAKITTNVIPGTATQTSTSSQDATFEDYTAGVTLKIKPHISKGDMLRLEITLNRTDFDPTTKTIPVSDGTGGTTPVPYPPDRTSTDITTVSTIPDGTTIILGGLEKINQGKLQTKVPILGDLPLLGGLFRGVNNNDKQGKLYVFVKANILRPSDQVGGLEDIRRVSSKNRKAFEDMERKFQGLQNWPGIPPKTVDPGKVLEEDEESLLTEQK